MDTVSELLRSCRGEPGCGVERTLKVLDGKWTTLIVRELLGGPQRFGEIRKALRSPSAKTLTDRLRLLEHQGILTRTVYAEVPPRVVYELTERGRSLSGILHSMLVWGEQHPEVDDPAGLRPAPDVRRMPPARTAAGGAPRA